MPTTKRLLTATLCGALLAVSATPPAFAAPVDQPAITAAARASDKTSAAEKKRVDSVKTPKLGWYPCYGHGECATVKLPLDYDKPNGATTEIAVLRVKAKNQRAKIGSLFVNPGGPGGSGTQIALAAPQFLSESVLERFDIVGVDPRGIASSQNVRCFASVKDQTKAYAGLNVAFPYGKAEEAAYIKSAKAIGRGCSTTGKPLSGAMSTAEVARDMDVLRRAVGDKKLTFLGFSYGSALGQYYANMFPDRVRAITVDGVINPVNWAGTPKTSKLILDDRLRSADGAYKALIEILKRCDTAGETHCAFAAGDPVKNFETLTRKLKAKPAVITDETGTSTITYADFIGGLLGSLYSPFAGELVIGMTTYVWEAVNPDGSVTAARQAAAQSALAKRIADARRTAPARDFPYDNGLETFAGVACTDGLHPKDAASWPALTAKSDKRAPYFGRAWAWSTAACAANTWTVRDEDAYRGPFTKRTAAPVLVVGNYWDPATNYVEAVESAKLLPNSRLLSSTNWGHTAYGTSKCATDAIDTYLLTGTLPAVGTVCEGDIQPFTEPLTGDQPDEPTARKADRADESKAEIAADATPTSDEAKQLPPVTVRVPASTLNGTR
ncbi:alpha/beta hydrolase [Actinoplanes sp. NPDC051346]|uniref:alpha/beta hydrolase n=1 Tax=Actinoplanes sp. NPDC051346 TaxID=3155048 RepID=UPI0034412942